MQKIAEQNSKRNILNAAIKLFAQKGYDGCGIREICSLAGVNISSVSYYFGGKKELYAYIIDDLIERQTEYAETFLDFSIRPFELSKKEQIKLLFLILDKIIDFLYSKAVSKELLILLFKEQQNMTFAKKSPLLNYLRELLSCIFEKDKNDREMVYCIIFIISQINSARILPAFSLKLLNQKDFCKQDIEIIRKNIRFYVNSLLREANIV